MEFWTALAAIPPAIALGVPAVRWATTHAAEKVKAELKNRQDVHEAEDKLIHEHVNETLTRMDHKLDLLLERKK